MDWTGFTGFRAGGPSLSPTSTTSTTMIPTPAASDTGGANPGLAPSPSLAPVPAGSLRVTSLSATHWRPRYPRIGQFAMTPSEEVVAATPDGLVHFMRVQDHCSKPWSQPRPFPLSSARLDNSTVTGVALHQEMGVKGSLHVYCVADGVLHAFSRSGDLGSAFVVDRSPPFAGSRVSGTPAVAEIGTRYDDPNWCVIVPCWSGGILYTSTHGSQGSRSPYATKINWEPAKQIAAPMGIISAVSVAVTASDKPGSYSSWDDKNVHIVAVVIASGRLHTIEGPLEKPYYPQKNTWQGPISTRIQHPGEVTGNPVLLSNREGYDSGSKYLLDLLVPSAEGGIFHFIRTPKTPDEWHMIGRISFPLGVPMASSLAFARLDGGTYSGPSYRAHVQCGGRLYLIKTIGDASPWAGSLLYPISGPGPFPH